MVSFPTGSNSFSWQCEGWILHSLDLRHTISQTEFTVSKVLTFFDHETIIHFFVRNSLIRHLCWDDQIAKKLSVLKPQRLKILQYFFLFSYHNFEDTVANFDNRKESFCGTNSYS